MARKYYRPIPKSAHTYLSYDPATGALVWNHRDISWFNSEASCRSWNAKNAGKPAMQSISSTRHAGGVLTGKIEDTVYAAARVIWFLMTGQDASDDVVCLDGDPYNLQWDNLDLKGNTQWDN